MILRHLRESAGRAVLLREIRDANRRPSAEMASVRSPAQTTHQKTAVDQL